MQNNVKIYRLIIGLTQKELAEYLNISRQSYSMKEIGNNSFKDEEKIKLKSLFKKVDNDITIDKIFFENRTSLLN